MAKLIVKSPYIKCGGSGSAVGYMKYIATRPRAERLGSHGLFGDEDGVDLEKTMAELECYTGNVWIHILSLKREDATRLGYDNAEAWRNLLRTHRNEIAAAMNIPAGDFRWYAAFHDEGDHPHVHMIAWSVKPGLEVHDPQEGLRWLETAASNGSHHAAYRLGKEYLKGRITEKDSDKAVRYFTQAAEAGNQFAQYMLGKLYLAGEDVPQDREQARYWFSLSTSQGNPYAKFFLDRWEQMKPPSVFLSVTRLLHHMGRVFMDNAPPPGATGMQTDKKLRQKIRRKKIAMGHKPDDHEEQSYSSPTMSM